MKLLALNATNQSITAVMSAAVTTTAPDFVSTYADSSSSDFLEAPQTGQLNGTTPVTLVNSPAASTRRLINDIVVYNRDSVSITVTLNFVDGANTRILKTITIEAGGYATFEGVFDSNGSLQTTLASLAASSITGQVSTTQGGTGQNWGASSGIPLFTAGAASLLNQTGSGDVVRATSPTIVTPTVASFVNANHNHADSAGGGTLASTAISDFSEAVDDRVNALVTAGTGLAKSYDDAGNSLTLYNVVPMAQIRVTPVTGTAVPTLPQTAVTHLYVTPYNGNMLTLYDGTRSRNYAVSSDIDLSLSGLTADTNYDYYVYDSSGTLTAEAAAWTGNTPPTRALQDGYLVKSSDHTRRLVASFRITGTTGQTQIGSQKYFVSNLYNRVWFDYSVIDTTASWTDTGTAWKQWNSSSANQCEFLNAVDEHATSMMFIGKAFTTNSKQARIGIGLDSTSTAATMINDQNASASNAPLATYFSGRLGLGYHYLALLQQSTGATVTFVGQSTDGYSTSGAQGQFAA